MLKKIYITGHACNTTCHDTLKANPKELDAIIICNSNHPEPNYLKDLTKSYLVMRFDDVAGPWKSAVVPTKEHVEKMLNWSEGKENMLIACHAGISRSSATALLIAVKNWGMDKGFGVLEKHKHNPNPLIASYGSGILGVDVHYKLIDWKTCKWHPLMGQN